MKEEVFLDVAEAASFINEALKRGFFPEEDALNGPKTKALPAKLRRLAACGCNCIHLNSNRDSLFVSIAN